MDPDKPLLLPRRIVFLLLALLTACASRPGHTPLESYHPAEGARLAVIGVGNRVEDREFSDLRVGFGIRSMLSEALYDTGKFQMLEEKRAIRDRLDLSQETIWKEGVRTTPEDLQRFAEALDADAVACATVTSYRVPTSGVSAGFFSRSKAMARLEIQVCIYQRATGHLFCRTGKGSADFVVDGLFVSYRDDGRLSTKSLIGKASKEAIENAIGNLMNPS